MLKLNIMENKTPEDVEKILHEYFLEQNGYECDTRIFEQHLKYVVKSMQEYGKQQYNQGVLDAAESATFDKRYVPSKIDKESMKKLIKQ